MGACAAGLWSWPLAAKAARLALALRRALRESGSRSGLCSRYSRLWRRLCLPESPRRAGVFRHRRDLGYGEFQNPPRRMERAADDCALLEINTFGKRAVARPPAAARRNPSPPTAVDVRMAIRTISISMAHHGATRTDATGAMRSSSANDGVGGLDRGQRKGCKVREDERREYRGCGQFLHLSSPYKTLMATTAARRQHDRRFDANSIIQNSDAGSA